MMLISYKDYLRKENISYTSLKRIDEMAKYGQVLRKSYQFDNEDLDFLQQFNHSLWAQAHHQRMELLFDVLEKATKVNEELGLQKLIRGLAMYFKDRTDENKKFLEDLDEPLNMTEEELENIGSAYFTAGLKDEEIDRAAEKAAIDHYNAKKKELTVIDNPTYHDFVFKDDMFVPQEGDRPIRTGGKRSKKEITIRAKPHLLRLYHKLETNVGDSHPKNIEGLTGKGKYGLDLGGALRGQHGEPHATRGMKFPTYKNVSDSMQRYFELLAHRVYGEFDDTVTWIDSGLKDNFIKEEALRTYIKQIRDSGMFDNSPSENIKYKKIMREAKRKLIEEIRSGRNLKGPPYPGSDQPNGFEITAQDIIKTKKGQRGEAEEIEDVKAPPLYLPYKKVNDRWVLQGKQGHFYKKIENKKDADPTAIRGWKGNYMIADDVDDPTGKAINKDGGVFLNQNTPKNAKLTKGTKEFNDAVEKILKIQKKGSFTVGDGFADVREDMNGDYILPILQGVISCINTTACGPKTPYEIQYLLKYIPQIYQFAYQYIEDNLDSNAFYDIETIVGEDGQEIVNKTIKTKKTGKSPSGRNLRAPRVNPLHKPLRTMAHAATALISQKAITAEGGGARQRAKTQDERLKRLENPLYQYRIQQIEPLKGDKELNIRFSYNQENYRNYLADLNWFLEKSQELAKEKKELAQASHNIINKRIDTITTKETLKNLILKNISLESSLDTDYVLWLTSLIRSGERNVSQEQAQERAQTIVNDWKKDNLSPQQMADAFLNYPIVKNFTEFLKEKANQASPATSSAQKPQASLPNALIQKVSNEALKDLDDEIANRGGDMNHPAIRAKFVTPAQGSKYSNYVVEIGKDLQTDQQFSDDPETLDAVLSRVQKSINKKLGIAEIQYANGSSPPVIKDLTVSRNADWHKLLRVEQTPQNLFDIVFDPKFKGENVIDSIVNAVEKRIDRIKSLFTQSDYDKMKERLKQVRKEMDDYYD